MMFIPYEEYKLDAWWKNQIHCYHLKKKLPSINLFWGSNMFYIGFEDKLQRIVYSLSNNPTGWRPYDFKT